MVSVQVVKERRSSVEILFRLIDVDAVHFRDPFRNLRGVQYLLNVGSTRIVEGARHCGVLSARQNRFRQLIAS